MRPPCLAPRHCLTALARRSLSLYSAPPSYTVEVGVCFLVLCDKSYPKLLAFSYLMELQNEFFEVFTHSDVQAAMRPYECIKFGPSCTTKRKAGGSAVAFAAHTLFALFACAQSRRCRASGESTSVRVASSRRTTSPSSASACSPSRRSPSAMSSAQSTARSALTVRRLRPGPCPVLHLTRLCCAAHPPAVYSTLTEATPLKGAAVRTAGQATALGLSVDRWFDLVVALLSLVVAGTALALDAGPAMDALSPPTMDDAQVPDPLGPPHRWPPPASCSPTQTRTRARVAAQHLQGQPDRDIPVRLDGARRRARWPVSLCPGAFSSPRARVSDLPHTS